MRMCARKYNERKARRETGPDSGRKWQVPRKHCSCQPMCHSAAEEAQLLRMKTVSSRSG